MFFALFYKKAPPCQILFAWFYLPGTVLAFLKKKSGDKLFNSRKTDKIDKWRTKYAENN
jgi:hypothetical protein